MWRSAPSAILRRRPQRSRQVIASVQCLPLGTSKNAGELYRQYPSFRFSTTNNGDDSNNKKEDDDSDSDDEGWVPPVRGLASETAGTLELPKSERLETILEVSRQVKEHERMDKVIRNTQEEMDALLQLSEEELSTLTDEQILQRVELALKREEELEAALFQQELEREEQQQQKQQQQHQSSTPDWLSTRLEALGQDGGKNSSKVPVLEHTLLKADEITTLLKEHGGTRITLIEDDIEEPRMGGAKGMIFCTGGGSDDDNGDSGSSHQIGYIDNSPYLISTLSRVLIDHMKDRKLHEIGSAQENTKNRSSSIVPSLYGSSSASTLESWKIVDCGNYIVHILDSATRTDLRLEDLWSGFDPLWRLNILDDDAVEEYCVQNPVPSTYDGSRSSNRDGDDFDDAVLKRLERNQVGFQRRHKPVIPQSLKNKSRRAQRKLKRLQSQK